MKNRNGRGRRGDGWIHSLPFFDGCKTPEKPPQTSATPFFFSCLMTPLTSFCLCFFLLARGFLFLCVCRSISSAKKGKEKEQTHTHTPDLDLEQKKKLRNKNRARSDNCPEVTRGCRTRMQTRTRGVYEEANLDADSFFFFFFFSKR